MFNDKTGAILMSAKRSWAGYKLFNANEEFVADFNFNWGRTTYELKTPDKKTAVKFKYDYTNMYADFYLEDFRTKRTFKSKRPAWDDAKGCFTMTFHRKDYQASAKNFQLEDEEERTLVELGKMEDGYYRLEYVDSVLDQMTVAALAITRFHV